LPGSTDNALQQVDTIRQGQMFGPIDPYKTVPRTATREEVSSLPTQAPHPGLLSQSQRPGMVQRHAERNDGLVTSA